MEKLRIPLLLISALLLFSCATTQTEPAVSEQDNPPSPEYQKQEVRIPEGIIDIQQLIDSSPDDSIIEIPFGEYIIHQGLKVYDRTNLLITSRPGTRILLTDTYADVMEIASSSAITVENMLLRHEEPLQEYACHGSVLRIGSSGDVSVRNCDLNGCGAVGVFVRNSENITIEHNRIHNNSFNGLYLASSTDIIVYNNVIEDNRNALQTEDVRSLEMSDNLIRNNGGYWRQPGGKPGLSGYPGP